MSSDLMATAISRRLLLELGIELPPELGAADGIGPVEAWIHQPHADLDSKTPLQVLGEIDGEARLRSLLARRAGVEDQGPEQDSLWGCDI